MRRWIARRFGRDRRWISDPAERDAHDRRVRARLAEASETDEATSDEHASEQQPPRDLA